MRAGRLLRCFAWLIMDALAVAGVNRRGGECTVLVRVDAIGDFVLWLESARRLREVFSGRRVILVCNKLVAGLARRCNLFDEVLGVDVGSFVRDPVYRWKTVRMVRALGAAVAVQPTYSRTLLTGDALVRATGAPQRIGSAGDLSNMRDWERRISDRWYSRLVPADPSAKSELERNCEFIRGLGMHDALPAVGWLPNVAELHDSLRIDGDYFMVVPGAGSASRIWPPERFAATARAIASVYGWRLVVCGTVAEAGIACAVADQAELRGTIDLTGKTSLPELVELIRGARLLIANETSALHISAAVGTPSVGVVGGGHFHRFVPYPESVGTVVPEVVYKPMECFGCNWHCIKPHKEGQPVPCVEEVETEAVIRAVESALDRRCILAPEQ